LTINYDRTDENSNNAVTAIYMRVGYLVKEVLLVWTIVLTKNNDIHSPTLIILKH
jgi:hypothetical protein